MDYECRQRVDMDTSDPDSQKMLRNDWRFQTSRQSSGQLTDGSESDNIVIPISPDLVFGDVTLERAYRTLHTESQKNLDIQFHVARSLAWGVVGLRMLKDSSIFSHYLESSIVLFGAISTLLPAYAYQMFDRNAYSTTYRPIVVILDNVLQVGLGCLTHQHIYPEPATSWLTASTWRAIAVYLTGSGFSWLNMSGLLGSLTFRFAWPQQTILTVIMLMASPRMCHRSYSLQKAHANAFIIVLSIMDRLLPQSILQYVMGSTYDAVVALRAGQDSESGYSMCVSGQTGVLLIFGFLLPTLYLFMHETRSRIRFIRAAESYSHQRAILFPYPSLLHYLAFAAPAMAMLFLYIAQQQ